MSVRARNVAEAAAALAAVQRVISSFTYNMEHQREPHFDTDKTRPYNAIMVRRACRKVSQRSASHSRRVVEQVRRPTEQPVAGSSGSEMSNDAANVSGS